MPRKPLLGAHNIHGHLGAEEDAQEIDFHDRLHLRHGQLRERPSSSIDPRIIYPIANVSQFVLGEFPEFFAAGGIADVALCVIDIAVGVVGRQGFGGGCTVLDVADDDVVAAVHEFAGVGEAYSAGGASYDYPSVGHGV